MDFEWLNQQELQNLQTGSIRISPLRNQNEYFKTIIATFQFPESRVHSENLLLLNQFSLRIELLTGIPPKSG
jgi:hypothetical protein